MSDEDGAPLAVGPGAMLARERAARSLSIADVAGRLKYGVKQIESIEADDYARLGGTTFVRGMLRAYCKLLGIDAAPVLSVLDQRHIPDPVTVDLRTRRIPFPDGRKRTTRMYLSVSLLALLVVAGVLADWHWGEALFGRAGSAATVVETQPQVAAAGSVADAPADPRVGVPFEAATSQPAVPVAPIVPVAAGAPDETSSKPGNPPGRVELEFRRESWVEIRDRRGRILLSQLNPVGAREVVEGEPPFDLVIGNAQGVKVSYNNSPVDLRPHTKVEVARMILQ